VNDWYSCDQCSAEMSTRTGMLRHHKIVHPQPKPIPKNLVGCVVCGKGFENQAKMMQHIITHRMDGSASKSQILDILNQHMPDDGDFARAARAVVPYVIEEEP